VFYKKLPTYNPIMTDAKKENIRHNFKDCSTSSNYQNKKGMHSKDYDGTKRYPVNIIKYNRKQKECHPRKILHPTQKPIGILEYLIKTYSNENDLILDNTMGVGSTLVACKNTNRNGIGIEMNEDYFNIAQERTSSAVQLSALF